MKKKTKKVKKRIKTSFKSKKRGIKFKKLNGFELPTGPYNYGELKKLNGLSIVEYSPVKQKGFLNKISEFLNKMLTKLGV